MTPVNSIPSMQCEVNRNASNVWRLLLELGKYAPD